MPSKYDQYRMRTGDQIGDPEYWNAPRLKDIDLRLTILEDQKTTLDAVIEEGRTAFRARVDDILLPLVQEVYDIAQVGVMLRAHSSTEIEIATGGKTLFIDASEKDRFAAPAYVSVMADGDPSRAMFGSVLSYSLETGELVIDVDRYIGAGNGADWIVTVANTTDGANDADRAENAASAALQHRNQSEASKISAEGAAASATAQSAAAVLANTQAQAAKNDAQTYRGDVISAISSWTSSVLPPSSINPSTRPGGAALQVGDQFFKTTDNLWRTWSGSQWTVNAVPSGSSVASVFGRTGAVDAQANDYRGDQIARTTAQQSIITGATVEAALQTLKTSLSAETTNRTTAISTAVAPKADKTTTIATSGLATGGGDLSANRTISVTKSSQAQAAAGTDDSTAMTPLRTKEAIDALVPAASETLSGKVRLATSAETQTGVATNLAVHPAGLKAAIDTRISGIINGSTAALDTLAELASALGNDANFSATVTSALASKAPLNGAGVSGTWGISITGTAQFANGAAWSTITGRPTALSAFTNDSGFITTAGRAFPKKADGGDFNLNWSGQAGQPTWLVGSGNGVDFFVWNPANFSVSYATNSGNSSALVGRTPTSFGLDRLTDVNAAAARAGIDAPSTGGAGASGTWPISVSGAAAGLANSPGSAPHFSCRAFVNFNGTGTVAIRSAGNVSSVTDLGNGIYTLNFITPMPDANYCVVGSAAFGNSAWGYQSALVVSEYLNASNTFADKTTAGVCIGTFDNNSDGTFDAFSVNVAIFR